MCMYCNVKPYYTFSSFLDFDFASRLPIRSTCNKICTIQTFLTIIVVIFDTLAINYTLETWIIWFCVGFITLFHQLWCRLELIEWRDFKK